MPALELAMGFLLRLSFFQRHLSWASVNALTSWALLSSAALCRLFIVSKSWHSHTPGTPASEATSPRLLNSLAGTQLPYEGLPPGNASAFRKAKLADPSPLLRTARPTSVMNSRRFK
jgi:hypothetical protein